MTTSQLQKLTPEEKRVKIAEHLGWKLVDLPAHPNGPKLLWMTPEGRQLNMGTPDTVPDYRGDSNAALTLVDHLAKQGWRCNLGNGLDKTWECEFMRSPTAATHPDFIGIHQGETLEIRYVPADTLAEAICDGFLLATVPDPAHEKESAFLG